MSGIDCRQAETLVARYIKHTLSTDELEEFLDHITEKIIISLFCSITQKETFHNEKRLFRTAAVHSNSHGNIISYRFPLRKFSKYLLPLV